MAASGSFGASNLKISSLELNSLGTRLGNPERFRGPRFPTPVRYRVVRLSRRSEKALIGCRCSNSESGSATATSSSDGSEEASSSKSQLIPNSHEVETLLREICDTTSIAEFELKLAGFRLLVRRDLNGRNEASPPPVSAPSFVNSNSDASDLNGSASSQSLAITKQLPRSDGAETLLDKASDEGLVIIKSPKVGFFRRSRTIKGKRMPPPCKENQTVREGQPLCYIEQLGGEFVIKSKVAGEVIKILREDGDPVEYNEALIVVLPSFPGIKKLR